MSSVYILRCFLANCYVYTRYWNTCIVRYKFIYVYGVVCFLSWNIYFFVYIYTYIVMYLVLRVGRALYDLFFAYFSESALTHEISSLKTTAARLKFKGIDGGLHKRWSMWFNSKQRAEPYQSLQYTENNGYALYFGIQALHGCRQFVA